MPHIHTWHPAAFLPMTIPDAHGFVAVIVVRACEGCHQAVVLHGATRDRQTPPLLHRWEHWTGERRVYRQGWPESLRHAARYEEPH